MNKLLWISGITVLSACATAQPPAELVEARAAYAKSERAEAARYDPAAVHEARMALRRAEKLYESEGEGPEVRDAAYIAQRRAERALVEGETVAIQHRNEEAARAAEKERVQAAAQAQTELQETRAELKETQRAREDAESRAREALQQLQTTQTAAVMESDKGTVITLAGAFLFPSNKSTLLPSANAKLDKVADVLKQQEEKHILIEGHTDSRGSAQQNLELSKQRAEAVASYLAARGVAREHITTQGVGADRPTADNQTPEGRATNRRVEITVQDAPSR